MRMQSQTAMRRLQRNYARAVLLLLLLEPT